MPCDDAAVERAARALAAEFDYEHVFTSKNCGGELYDADHWRRIAREALRAAGETP